ncbi:hypothetical protein SGLAD_v1c10230 [Spiroplasma gladiatoris]|uniref:R3H domain-containing protein n=1 Tax=Spiroplasma gladiatoris TaxID=2143 RepID=A0A4P7AIX4_9MOLU|nr:hypothetical protein [Spiroplasma gladiatoris]QBQ08222.1 hypothetical protein SGLAD_v1c10230 [Spiroplasma gladiatoris]
MKKMLKLNNKKFYHFFNKVRPNVNFIYRDQDKELVLFLSNSKRLEILEFIKKIVETNFNVKVFSVIANKKSHTNKIFIKPKTFILNSKKNTLKKFIEIMCHLKFNITVNFTIVDYYHLYLGNKLTTEDSIKKLIRTCLTKKETLYTLPVSKNKREKLYKLFLGYNLVVWKSLDVDAGKIIKIFFKTVK